MLISKITEELLARDRRNVASLLDELNLLQVQVQEQYKYETPDTQFSPVQRQGVR
jgi:hypothetical protein